PNYAPELKTVRTMYDLLRALFVDAKWLPEPATVSFRDDILPILQRLTGLGWVNSGFATGFGYGAPQYFGDPAYVQRLAQKGEEFAELRRQINNQFRVFERDGMSPVPWPWIYGDAMSIPATSPRQYNTLSTLQMRQLARWVAGDFVNDLDAPPPPRELAKVPLAEQPATLDRAALEFCLADAFHPGCEITWPIRQLSMFSAPFRIKHCPGATLAQIDYGPQLTPAIALAPDGPLYAQRPGGLSRWMAVPWQTDTASCQSGYDKAYDPLIPTFWAARVPNQVLTEADYKIATDMSRPPEERTAAFNHRPKWMRILATNYQVYINQMVSHFGAMGVVEARERPARDKLLPPRLLVESVPGPIPTPPKAAAKTKLLAASAAPAEHEIPDEKVHRIHR
ncbi:MAG TPA: LodA/GoxA family CTQ-dependent oxidase, partial [Opitutaceae bacterium]